MTRQDERFRELWRELNARAIVQALDFQDVQLLVDEIRRLYAAAEPDKELSPPELVISAGDRLELSNGHRMVALRAVLPKPEVDDERRARLEDLGQNEAAMLFERAQVSIQEVAQSAPRQLDDLAVRLIRDNTDLGMALVDAYVALKRIAQHPACTDELREIAESVET